MHLNFYSLILGISFLLSAYACYFTRKQRNTADTDYLFLLLLSGLIWLFFEFLEALVVPLSLKLYFSQFKFIGISTAPVFLGLFILEYTQKIHWIREEHYPWLFLLPFLSIIGVFTNPIHHLHFSDIHEVQLAFFGPTLLFRPGLNYWMIIVYSFVVLIGGFFILFRSTARFPVYYKYQTFFLIPSLFLPVFLFVFHLISGNRIIPADITPLSFPIAGLLLVAGIKNHGLLSEKPMEMHLLYNSLEDGVVFLDHQENIINMNPSAKRILDRFENKSNDSSKKNMLQYPEFYQLIKSSDKDKLEFKLTDESDIYFEVEEKDLSRKDITLSGKLILLRNISEHKAITMRLMHQKDEMQHVIHQKDKMFSIVTHDLRSPFSSIIGLAEIMNTNYDKITDDKRKTYVAQFLNRTKITYDLIENLLQWAKSQNKGFDNNYSPINLNIIIQSTVKFYQSMATDKQIRLSVSESKEQQPEIFGNDQLIRTILRNLITNAIKFTPDKGKVTIAYNYLPDYFQVSVSDTGIGIPSDKLKTLLNFENPYHTLGTKKESGSGLGLSLCQEFVTKMGGKLWITSEDGNGSTIFFNLPYSPKNTIKVPVQSVL